MNETTCSQCRREWDVVFECPECGKPVCEECGVYDDENGCYYCDDCASCQAKENDHDN